MLAAAPVVTRVVHDTVTFVIRDTILVPYPDTVHVASGITAGDWVTLLGIGVAAFLAVKGWERATRTAVEVQLRADREQRRRLLAELLLRLEGVYGPLSQIASIIANRESGVFKAFGPAPLTHQYGRVRDALQRLEPLQHELRLLDSNELQRQVEEAIRGARHRLTLLERESRNYIDGVTPWDEEALPYWTHLGATVQHAAADIRRAMDALERLGESL